MSRYHVKTTGIHPSGVAAAGSDLTFYAAETGSTLATLYAAATGATTVDNPYTIPAGGSVEFWVDDPDLWVLPEGSTVREPVNIHRHDTVVYSVLDYGATGDGATDDTLAIQSAIDDVFDAMGGTVYFPQGEYILTSALVLKAQVRLIGESQRNSIITQTGTAPVISVDDDAPSSVWGNEIAFLKLQGNLDDAATGDVFYSKDTYRGFEDCWFHDLFIQGCGRDAFHFEHTGDSSSGDWHQYLRFERIYMRDRNWDGLASGVGRYGIYAYGTFSTNSIRDCKFYYCGSDCIHIEKNANSSCAVSNVIDTCVMQHNGDGDVVAHGVYIKGAHATTLINNYFEDIGLDDTSHASAAVCIDDVNTRSVNIIGNFTTGCWVHYSLIRGSSVFIDGGTLGWTGTTPASSTGILIGANFEANTLRIGALTFNAGTSSDDMTWITNNGTQVPQGLLTWVASSGQTDGNFSVRRLRINALNTFTAKSSPPTTGTWAVGDICYNSAPSAGEAIFWVCTSAGTPGTWVVGQTLPKNGSPPASGAYTVGDVVYNSGAASGQPTGWICTAAGSPGSWTALASLP
jgi:hypothetical protein